MQSALIIDPTARLTPTQRAALDARRAFREKIAARAKADTGLKCMSVAERVALVPDIPKQILPDPTMTPVDPGYIPPPWIPDGRRSIDIRSIQERVCKFYGVSRADLLSARRTLDVVRPRQVAVYLSKKLTAKSLPQIGRAFGGRDHSTALSSIRKITSLIEKDAALERAVAEMATELEAFGA